MGRNGGNRAETAGQNKSEEVFKGKRKKGLSGVGTERKRLGNGLRKRGLGARRNGTNCKMQEKTRNDKQGRLKERKSSGERETRSGRLGG
jgi:hypothetical protein